jgi:hypothetical protein
MASGPQYPVESGRRARLCAEPDPMDEFTRCSVCTRTPLIGEQIAVIASGHRESAVCELCLERPRAGALGELVRRERIRSTAGAANVRRAWPVPTPQRAEPVGTH